MRRSAFPRPTHFVRCIQISIPPYKIVCTIRVLPPFSQAMLHTSQCRWSKRTMLHWGKLIGNKFEGRARKVWNFCGNELANKLKHFVIGYLDCFGKFWNLLKTGCPQLQRFNYAVLSRNELCRGQDTPQKWWCHLWTAPYQIAVSLHIFRSFRRLGVGTTGEQSCLV